MLQIFLNVAVIKKENFPTRLLLKCGLWITLLHRHARARSIRVTVFRSGQNQLSVMSFVKNIEARRGLQLKPFQLLSIEKICTGKDVFVCAPTGMGKSLCYGLLPDFVDMNERAKGIPTVTRPITVVVSPLVALIKDQVDKFTMMGIPACGLTEDTDLSTINDARSGHYRLVFVSPEGILGKHMSLIESDVFQECISALVVDEAHCITEW